MLKIDHLYVKYPSSDRYALKDLSFELADGEHAALLGANGAGKSTLLLSVTGIVRKEQGEINVGGTVLSDKTLPEIRRKAGLVFQNPDNQLFMPTVSQDIAFGPRNYGIPEEEIRSRTDALLSMLGMEELKERMIHTLSGGEKRLAALAGILILEPSLLLLDEPTSFLDNDASSRLSACIRDLKQSILITTHDLAFASECCTRFLFLEKGELKWSCGKAGLHDHLPPGWLRTPF